MPSAVDTSFLTNGQPVAKDAMRDALASIGVELEHAGFFDAGVERKTADKLSETLSVTDFGAVGDGAADDTAAFSSAIEAADGAPLFVPSGRYRVALSTSRPVHLHGPGVLLGRSGTSTIAHRPEMGMERAINRIRTAGWPSASGPDHSYITLNADGLSVGDVVLLYAQQRYSWLNSVWVAEAAEIVAIEGGEVVLGHRLNDLNGSTPSPRLRAFPRSRFVIDGLEFQAESSIDDPAAQRVPTLDVRAPNRPYIRARCTSAYERFVILRSPWLGQLDIETIALRDWPSESGYGYGVDITGAGMGTRVRVQGARCRHIVTGNIFKTGSFSSNLAHSYGRPRSILVHDSVSAGTHGGAAFDTHEGCLDWVFHNCLAIHPRIDPDGEPLAAGFSDRGQFTTFSNCHVIGGTRGFRLNVNAIEFDENVTRLIDCSVRNLTGSGSRAISVTGSSRATPVIEIDGFRSDFAGNFARISSAAEMTVRNATIGPTFDVAFDFAGSGATLTLDGVTFDQRGADATAAIRTRGATTIRAVTAHIEADATPKPFVRNEGSATVTVQTGVVTSPQSFAWAHPASAGPVGASSIARTP